MRSLREPLFKKTQWLFTVFCLVTLSPVFTANIFALDPLKELTEGNQRFVNNAAVETSLTLEARKKLSAGQTPFATIVACSDSRVAPEIIFDQGVGELFVVRLAGNTVDDYALASIEYGISYLKTPLLLVMGHANCGAVKAAFDIKQGNFNPELARLLKNIEPAVNQAIKQNPGKSNGELVNAAIRLNVQVVENEISKRIPAVEKLKKNGQLKVKGAVFELDTGQVQWIN